MRKLLFVTAIAGAVAALMRRQRERELDDAIWEEPRDLTPATPVATPETTEPPSATSSE